MNPELLGQVGAEASGCPWAPQEALGTCGKRPLVGSPWQGLLSGGSAQDWMVAGGESVLGPWEWVLDSPENRCPRGGLERPQGLGFYGPWVAELNKPRGAFGWGLDSTPRSGLCHSPRVKHWATHSWLPWLDPQPLRGPRWNKGRARGLWQGPSLLTSVQLLAPTPC